jgi:hypothetical protein
MVRQLGRLFLQPMIDAMWEQLEGPDAPDDGKPVLIPTLTANKKRVASG